MENDKSPEKRIGSSIDNDDDEDDLKSSSPDSIPSYRKDKKSDKRPAAFFKTEKPEKAPSETLKKEIDSHQSPASTESAQYSHEDEVSEEPLLSESELHETVADLIAEKEPTVAAELSEAEPETTAELVAVAHAAFLAELRDRVTSSEEVTEQTLDAVLQDTVKDLDLEDTITAESVRADADESVTEETDAQENTARQTPTVTVVTPPASLPPTQIPPLNAPPNQTSSLNATSLLSSPLSTVPSSTNVYNARAFNHSSANTVNPNTVNLSYNQIHRNNLLVGIVLGYIIGRRGGRKRTEKKLLPKMSQLEAQVNILNKAIEQRELRIKQIAYDYAESKKFSANTAEKKQTVYLAVGRRAEKLQKTRQERAVHYSKKELTRRIEHSRAHEKIGSLKLSALDIFVEKRKMDGTEQSPKRKPVELMTVQELLEKIGGLRVDGTLVSAAFKEHRISTEALREITKRYLRSGDYEAAYRYELLPAKKDIDNHRTTVRQLQDEHHTSSAGQAFKNDTKAASEVDQKVSNLGVKQPKISQITPQIAVMVILGAVAAVLLLLIYA